ncbi:MAG TPA: WD40 repeat domain-containing protein [Gemmataceae bacterium]|nr:WD40 repeat domain-containing protein [Gemmataceae bacterium]
MPDTPKFDKGALAWTLPWDDDWVTAVAVLGPTRRVAAGNNLGQVLVWDLPEKADAPAPAPVRRLDGHTNVISRLLATADGRWLISAGYDHTVRLWDMSASTKGTALVVPDANARAAAKKRGKPLPDAPVTVGLQQAERVLEGHKEWVQALSLTPDGKVLVSGDDAGRVIVWDVPSGKETRRWQVKGWVYALAVSPDARRLLISERFPLVYDPAKIIATKLWDATTGQVVRDLEDVFKKDYQSAAVFSLDGKLVAVGRGGEVNGPSGTIALLDAATGKKLHELKPGHEYGVTDLAFHPDGKHLASAGRDTVVRVWSAADGKLVKELGKARGGQFKDWIHAISFSADGRLLAAADMAGAVQVWNFPA